MIFNSKYFIQFSKDLWCFDRNMQAFIQACTAKNFETFNSFTQRVHSSFHFGFLFELHLRSLTFHSLLLLSFSFSVRCFTTRICSESLSISIFYSFQSVRCYSNLTHERCKVADDIVLVTTIGKRLLVIFWILTQCYQKITRMCRRSM